MIRFIKIFIVAITHASLCQSIPLAASAVKAVVTGLAFAIVRVRVSNVLVSLNVAVYTTEPMGRSFSISTVAGRLLRVGAAPEKNDTKKLLLILKSPSTFAIQTFIKNINILKG